MSLSGDYDSQNVFAKILRGELPAYKVYEDDHVVSFLDAFPQSRGHILVVPKVVEARNILDIDPENLSRVIVVVQKLARALVDELQPEGVQVKQFNGAPAGQSVFHLHFHIIPCYSGQSLGRHAQGKADPAELEDLQQRLIKRIGSL